MVARQHGHVESGGPASGHPIGEHADRGDRLAGCDAPVVADVAQEHDPVRAGHGDGPVDGGQDAGGFQVDVADEQDGHRSSSRQVTHSRGRLAGLMPRAVSMRIVAPTGA